VLFKWGLGSYQKIVQANALLNELGQFEHIFHYITAAKMQIYTSDTVFADK